MARATGPFVLPEDVSISSVEDLARDVRYAVGASSGDFAVARPHSRSRVTIVDAATAELLESFRAPQSIVDAIIAFSRRRGTDAETTLIDAFPQLRGLVRDGFLVPADSSRSESIAPHLALGTRVSGFEVISCVNAVEDTEVYQVRDTNGGHGALKIAAPSDAPAAGEGIRHEARILELLNDAPVPRLLAAGAHQDRPFLITEWCSGVRPDVVAREPTGAPADRARLLLDLARAIVDAYAIVHAHRVVHGDVHPRNILVDAARRITILDFALARVTAGDGADATVPRGGVYEYMEPEYARAAATALPAPRATELSDQYSVAALLFRLFTDASYLEFSSLRETRVHRQIALNPPRTFAQCGVPSWPDVEVVLAKALSKNAERRYQSMTEFSCALSQARHPHRPRPPRQATRVFDELVKRTLRRFGPDGELLRDGLRTPPFASVNFGAAGIAWAMYRLACVEDRPDLLALAEIWLQRARDYSDHPDAFSCDAVGVHRDLIGEVSLYYSLCGLSCVEASLALAMGDMPTHDAAVGRFMERSTIACDNPELSFGRSGTLLGCALLAEAQWSNDSARAMAIRALGDSTMQWLTDWMSRQEAISAGSTLRNLGMAHGWAGLCYAVSRWSLLRGLDAPLGIAERLDELGTCAEPSGRGVRWRWVDDAAADLGDSTMSMPGWCNGAAGFVHLWTCAYSLLRTDRFLELAELAAWEVWEHEGRVPSLCCGLTGRAYALLNFFRYTGESVWLDRAHHLAMEAARRTLRGDDGEFPDSLFKGELGVTLLAVELARPAEARMPFFEPEGWPH
jgi:hypothetical protein